MVFVLFLIVLFSDPCFATRGSLTSEQDQWHILVAAEQHLCEGKSLVDLTRADLPHGIKGNVGVIYRTINHYLLTGTIRKGKKRKQRSDQIKDFVRQNVLDIVLQFPSAYIDEIAQRVVESTGLSISESVIESILLEEGYTVKRAEFRNIRRLISERYRCRQAIDSEDPQILVFIDETHADPRKIRRDKGRSLRGVAPVLSQAHIASLDEKGLTLIAACNFKGVLIGACQIIEESNTRESFDQYVEYYLLPELKPYPQQNSVVVLDNASIHHGGRALDLIKGKGAVVIFLSPYSYDYNPIEKVFAQLKKYLKRHRGGRPREVPLSMTIFAGLQSVTGQQMANYFRNAHVKLPQTEGIMNVTQSCQDDDELLAFFLVTMRVILYLRTIKAVA